MNTTGSLNATPPYPAALGAEGGTLDRAAAPEAVINGTPSPIQSVAGTIAAPQIDGSR